MLSMSTAKNETFIMGPYMVSFDLNLTQEYNAKNETKHLETYSGIKYDAYIIELNSDGNFALISIAYYNDTMNKSIEDMRPNGEDFLRSLNNYNIKTHNRTIDNQPGVLSIGANSNGDCMFAAQYWASLTKYGDTSILIKSNYPWDNGTLSLLKTIHVRLICNTTEGIPKIESNKQR